MTLVRRLFLPALLLSSLFSLSVQGAGKTIYLARHGETETNKAHLLVAQQLHPGAVLTKKGERQAKKLAQLLGQVGVERIYVSRLKRTHQTAAPIATTLGLKPIVRSQLDEMNFGSLEGKPISDPVVQKALAQMSQDCDYRPGDGESTENVLQRLAEIWDEILRTERPQTVVFLGHYGTVRGSLQLRLGLTCEEATRIVPKNDNVYRLRIVDGQVVDLALSRRGGSFETVTKKDLLALDVSAHLKPSEPSLIPSAASGKTGAPSAR